MANSMKEEQRVHEEFRYGSPEAEDRKDVGEIVARELIPKPTNDPNDPLNWSKFEKYHTYLTVCFFTFLATVNASNFTVAVTVLSTEFHQNPTRTGYLVVFNILLLGCGNIVWVPLTRVIGKRPVYLFALLLLVCCNIWSYEAKSFGSLLGSRILSGFAASAADATVPSLVADLFFVHERGHLMMFFHLAMSCGFFLGPLIEAFITQYAGWRWNCGFIAITAAATFVVGIFTIHETSYPPGRQDLDRPAESYGPKHSFISKLGFKHGYNKNGSISRSVIDIISLVAYPPVTWVGMTIGSFVGWNIVVQLTSSRTFTKPPYKWELHDIGLLSISGFIGALLAFFFGGRLIDWISNRQTRKSAQRLPEYRLPAIIIPALIGPMGILIFGLVVAHKKSWVGAAVGYAMQGFGLTAVSNVCVTYAVDAYQPISGEVLVIIFVIRQTIGVILALFTTNWQAASGLTNTFGEMVAIQYFFLLLVIPLIFFGPRIRRWTERFGPMKRYVN